MRMGKESVDDSHFVIVFRVAVPKTLPPTTISQEKTRMLMPLSPISVPLRLGRYVIRKKERRGVDLLKVLLEWCL
jgi:hypothetical protein